MSTSMNVGNDFYLWYSGAFRGELTVSAHGSQTFTHSTFIVPEWSRILFYAPDGYSLLDDGKSLEALVNTSRMLKLMPYEVFEPGSECPNYNLSKYQGRHGRSPFPVVGYFMSGSNDETYEDVSKLTKGANRDVITVRNRVGFSAPSLRMLLRDMEVENLNGPYAEIHCSFCRANPKKPFKELDYSPYKTGETIFHIAGKTYTAKDC